MGNEKGYPYLCIVIVATRHAQTLLLSYCGVTPSGTGALYGIENPPAPVLKKVGDILNRVTVRQQIPAPGAITVVVEPGPKDQVRRSTKEHAVHVC